MAKGRGEAAEVAHGQRHFGFRNDAAGPCEPFARTEAASGAPQQIACECEIAELRHGDAAQRERRSVVAQRDELECTERVATGQGARGRGDDGIHAARLTRRAIESRACSLVGETLASRGKDSVIFMEALLTWLAE